MTSVKTALLLLLFLQAREAGAQQPHGTFATDTLLVHSKAYMPAHGQSSIWQLGSIVAPDVYTQHLPFFCRQELNMQRANVPLQLRLGNPSDCDRLEQKPGYRTIAN
jgi:hypothetical protein